MKLTIPSREQIIRTGEVVSGMVSTAGVLCFIAGCFVPLARIDPNPFWIAGIGGAVLGGVGWIGFHEFQQNYRGLRDMGNPGEQPYGYDDQQNVDLPGGPRKY